MSGAIPGTQPALFIEIDGEDGSHFVSTTAISRIENDPEGSTLVLLDGKSYALLEDARAVRVAITTTGPGAPSQLTERSGAKEPMVAYGR